MRAEGKGGWADAYKWYVTPCGVTVRMELVGWVLKRRPDGVGSMMVARKPYRSVMLIDDATHEWWQERYSEFLLLLEG